MVSGRNWIYIGRSYSVQREDGFERSVSSVLITLSPSLGIIRIISLA